MVIWLKDDWHSSVGCMEIFLFKNIPKQRMDLNVVFIESLCIGVFPYDTWLGPVLTIKKNPIYGTEIFSNLDLTLRSLPICLLSKKGRTALQICVTDLYPSRGYTYPVTSAVEVSRSVQSWVLIKFLFRQSHRSSVFFHFIKYVGNRNNAASLTKSYNGLLMKADESRP